MENKKIIFKLIITVILIFIGFEIFINTFGSLVATTTWDTIKHGKYTTYFLSEFIVLLCGLILLALRKKWYIFKNQKKSFKDTIMLCLPIVILSCLVFVTNVIELNISKLNIANLISLVFYCISIGLFEEIFFRGIIEEELLSKLSSNKKEVIISIILSGVIFGAIHFTNLLMGQDLLTTLMQFIQTMSIGILFGTVYYFTKNIWALAFLHGFYDFSVLLSEVNIVTGCGYVENVPLIITISSLVASIILSGIYLIYSLIIFKKENNEDSKKYHKFIYMLIIIYFISNALFGILGNVDINKYYVCPEYKEKEIKLIETHYYGYDKYYYNYDNNVIHIYKDNDKVIMKNENGIKINVNIDNVERIAIVDDAILIIATDNTNYKLYYNKLTDLKNINNFKEYDIPSSKSLGYLIDASTGYKYPCIKSITEDLFIIDNEELFIVKQAS